MDKRILLIEDEEKFARFVELELQYEGYQVSKAKDGRTGLQLAETGSFDLILLDIMLPEISGMEVLRRLRRKTSIPVILLTARDSVEDKVSGLDSGADDYITKPFAIEELLARIRKSLRKPREQQNSRDTGVLSAGALKLEKGQRLVTVKGTPVDLTKKQFDLLQFFLENKGLVLSRDVLLEHVWEYDFDGGTNAVDVYIRFLRSKLDEAFDMKLIHTIRGVGYVIKDE